MEVIGWDALHLVSCHKKERTLIARFQYALLTFNFFYKRTIVWICSQFSMIFLHACTQRLKFSKKFVQWFSDEKIKCLYKYWNSADKICFFLQDTYCIYEICFLNTQRVTWFFPCLNLEIYLVFTAHHILCELWIVAYFFTLLITTQEISKFYLMINSVEI